MDVPSEKDSELNVQTEPEPGSLVGESAVDVAVAQIICKADDAVLAVIHSLGSGEDLKIESRITTEMVAAQRELGGQWLDVMSGLIDELNISIEKRCLFPDYQGFVTPLNEQPIEDALSHINLLFVNTLKGHVFLKHLGTGTTTSSKSQSG